MATGTCLCGDIRFRLEGPFQWMMHCHCSRCRKHHGSAFATFVGAPATGFEWLAGRDRIVSWNGTRHFCGTCGSVVPAPDDSAELRFVPAGNLIDDCGVKPEMHIFAASKAPWHQITDAVSAFDGPPDGFPDPNIPTEARPPGLGLRHS